MNRKTSLAFAIAAAFLLAVVTIGGAGVTDAVANNTTVENETPPEAGVDTVAEPTGEGGYTVSELRQSGQTIENTPDSWRLSDERVYWLIHWPADTAFANVGDPEDSHWRYLSDGELVERNSVWFRSLNIQGAETVEVTVVSFATEETENGTVPVDVRERTTEVELERGQPLIEIDLPRADEEREVALWVEGREDELRWHFKHDAIATTEPMTITTRGDYLYQAGIEFLIPIIMSALIAGPLARSAIKRAHIGPMWGYMKWTMVIGVLGFIGAFFMFSSVAEVVVAAPWIIPGAIGLLVLVVILESYSANDVRATFMRPKEISNATSPSGDENFDVIEWEIQKEWLVRTGEGTSVIRPGLLPFLSRCFGGAARLENAAAIETRMPTNQDDLYFIDPDSDEILEYEPEGWELDIPEIDLENEWQTAAIYGLAGLSIVGLATALVASWAGFLTAIMLFGIAFVRPVDGYARIEPATAHQRRAYVSSLYLKLETEDARTIKKLQQKIPELEAEVRKATAESLREQNQTLVEETMGEESVAHTIEELAEQLGNSSNGTTPDDKPDQEQEASPT